MPVLKLTDNFTNAFLHEWHENARLTMQAKALCPRGTVTQWKKAFITLCIWWGWTADGHRVGPPSSQWISLITRPHGWDGFMNMWGCVSMNTSCQEINVLIVLRSSTIVSLQIKVLLCVCCQKMLKLSYWYIKIPLEILPQGRVILIVIVLYLYACFNFCLRLNLSLQYR